MCSCTDLNELGLVEDDGGCKLAAELGVVRSPLIKSGVVSVAAARVTASAVGDEASIPSESVDI